MSNENYLKYAQGKYILLYALLKNDFIFSISFKNIDNYLKQSNIEDNENLNLLYELAEKGENSEDLLNQALSILYSYPELYEEISFKKEDDKNNEEKKELDKTNNNSKKSIDSKSVKSDNSHKSRSKSKDSKISKSSGKSRSKSNNSKKSRDSGKSRSGSKSSRSSKSQSSSRSNSKDSKKTGKFSSRSKKSGESGNSKSKSKDSKKPNKEEEDFKESDKKENKRPGEHQRGERINIKTEKKDLEKEKENIEGSKEDQMKLKKEDFQGKYKELKLKESESNINQEIVEKKHIDIDSLNIKGFKKDLLIIVNKIISHVIITNKNDYKEEEKNKILEDPTLIKIISFFINLQGILKDKYFLNCINNDGKIEELLETIDLKDKNNSEELLKRLDELKKIKLENYDETDYTLIDNKINDWYKKYNEFFNKKLIQKYYEKQNKKEKAEIELKLNKLKSELQDELREESKKYIDKLGYIGLDKAQFEKAEKTMRKLIEAKKNEKKEEKNYISVFPPIKTKMFTNNTIFQRALDLLIYYSKIMDWVVDLTDESKWYSIYLKLEKFMDKKDLDESLATIIDNLLKNIWKNISQPEKKKEIISDFKIQLRSCILFSLYNINRSYLNLNNLRIELNRFIKGDYSTEQDKYWASGHVDFLLPKFTLLIPEIDVKDLIPLFALEKPIESDKDDELEENSKEVQKGIFFSSGLPSTYAKTFFKEVIKLKEKNYETFLKLLDDIFDLFDNIILKNMPIIKEEKIDEEKGDKEEKDKKEEERVEEENNEEGIDEENQEDNIEEKEEGEEEKEKDEEKIKNEEKINSRLNIIKKLKNPEHPYNNVFEFLENLYKYLPENEEEKN